VTPIPEQDVRAELDRILSSKGFSGAGRLSKLLRYVADKTLAGETGQLKEYAVGIEVFDRDEKYDPRLDSIVRVEAGRLRTRLDEYYNGEGAASPVRISLPRGGYVARFEPSQPPEIPPAPEAPARRRPTALFALAGVLAVAIGGMVWWLQTRDRNPHVDLRPTAAVLPFSANMIGGDNNYSEQITEAVTSELARLGTISVASFTSAMQFESRRPAMREIADALKSTYVVEGSAEDEASEMLVVIRLVNTENDRKVWVSDYRGQREDIRGIAERIAFDISAEILRRSAP
jgi:TolB-like protein